MKRLHPAFFAASAIALLSATSPAALVLQDNMDYGPGTIGTGVGDWVDGSNRLNYQGGVNVTYTGGAYVNDPANAGTGSLERNFNIDSRFFERDFTDAGLTGEFWMSSVINLDGNGGDNAGEIIGISLNTTGGLTLSGDLVGIGYDGTSFRPGWRDNSTSTTAYDNTRTLSTSSSALLISKFNIGAGADSFSMWAFAPGDSFGSTEASLGTAHLSSISADFGDELDRIQVGGVNGFQSYFDQVRISSLAGDAGLTQVLTLVPEPASVMLGGMGCLLLLRRRRG